MLKVLRIDALPWGSRPGVLGVFLNIFWLCCALLMFFWLWEPDPFFAFLLGLMVLATIGVGGRPGGCLQLLEHGMVLAVRGRVAFVPYGFVQCCQWEESSRRLVVRMKTTREECTIGPRDVEAVTRVLASRVEMRDESGTIISAPRASEGAPASGSAGDERSGPTKPVFARFQFTLRTVLLAALVASAASGWRAIVQRQTTRERAVAATLAPFNPGVFWSRRCLQRLDFSRSPVKPGDDDLEPLEELTGLRILNLSNTSVTDAGLVHLKNLKRLEFLWLSNTRITDAGLVRLHNLKKLDSISLNGTPVTPLGIAELQKALPETRVVY
ncbi:MAG TPA: hypothetical protein VMY37_24700 [Thermoguttaceae bacterium]|nr:hypothetical protein [Thermoguttaceae bacterium]